MASEVRFLLFAYDDYYPCGGWHDHKGSFTTFEEAKAAGDALTTFDFYDIIDVRSGTLVYAASSYIDDDSAASHRWREADEED